MQLLFAIQKNEPYRWYACVDARLKYPFTDWPVMLACHAGLSCWSVMLACLIRPVMQVCQKERALIFAVDLLV